MGATLPPEDVVGRGSPLVTTIVALPMGLGIIHVLAIFYQLHREFIIEQALLNIFIGHLSHFGNIGINT